MPQGVDWLAIGGAVIALISAVAALSQAKSARTQARLAKGQADSADRQAKAAEAQVKLAQDQADLAKTQADAAERAAISAKDQLETARRQLQLAIAALPVDYVPVLVAPVEPGSTTSEYRLIEIRWKGPQVELVRLVATRWANFDANNQPIDGEFLARDVELQPAEVVKLPLTIRNGDKVLFRWPGPQPGAKFSAYVRIEYSLAGESKATVERQVEIPGYDRFRG